MKALDLSSPKDFSETPSRFPDNARVNDLISLVADTVAGICDGTNSDISRLDEYIEIYFQDVPQEVLDHCTTVIHSIYEKHLPF